MGYASWVSLAAGTWSASCFSKPQMVPPVRDYGFFCRACRARTGGKTRVYLSRSFFFFRHKIDRFTQNVRSRMRHCVVCYPIIYALQNIARLARATYYILRFTFSYGFIDIISKGCFGQNRIWVYLFLFH